MLLLLCQSRQSSHFTIPYAVYICEDRVWIVLALVEKQRNVFLARTSNFGAHQIFASKLKWLPEIGIRNRPYTAAARFLESYIQVKFTVQANYADQGSEDLT